MIRKISNWKYRFNLWRKYKKQYWNLFYSDYYLLNRRKREYASNKIEIKNGIARWASYSESPVHEGIAIALDRLGLPVDLEKTREAREKYLKE